MLGILSFVLITIAQVSAYRSASLQVIGDDTVASYDWKVRLFSAALAILCIAYSINYTRSGQQKLYLVNRVGRLLAILALILCLLPLYKIYLR